MKRREFIRAAAGGLAAAAGGSTLSQLARAAEPPEPWSLPSGAAESAVLEALPGKLPLIKRSFRPPNFETPIEYFKEALTPNKAFFVRYHLATIPEVDAKAWRLKIGGTSAETTLELGLEELKSGYEQVETTAICLCSGNRRGLSLPHVAGVEWGVGAMGNARWKGVRLRDVLNKAGIKKDALEVVLDGADGPVFPKTPDFVKSLPVWKALDENTLLVWEMNGEALPHWNGFPVRLVVPGWTGTYWTKHITSVMAEPRAFSGFWMNPAYRIPLGKFPIVDRFISQESPVNTPITEIVVNSLITSVANGSRVRTGDNVNIAGIAWDGGYGIRHVEVSVDGGKSWSNAALGKDLGRFSFREWSYRFTPSGAGKTTVMAKATNRVGATQTFELIFNPAGYHHNVVQKVTLDVV